ncbi:MAG TPA: ABC transporter permease [Candidatus Dormibacteraeota bacterium]|nr:ABC transporter permease [Candidatus Dormibacteraeota bacterium]
MTQLGQNAFNGLVASGIYLLIALGITVVFGLTRLINFAHGQLLVLGTFIAYTATAHGYSFWIALAAAAVIVAVVAHLLERVVYRRTLSYPLNGLIVGLGVLTVLQVLMVKVWGPDPVGVNTPLDGRFDVGGVALSYDRLIALGVAIVFTAAFMVLLQRSRLGAQMKASQQNALAAAHVGVNVGRIISVAFVIGSAAAGAAGAVLGTLFPLDTYQGGNFLIKGFAVALLGGLGNVSGAILASLVYGVGETMIGGYLDPSWVPAYTFGIIVVILLIRPQGLFGTSDEHSSQGQFGERLVGEARRALHLPLPARGGYFALAVAAMVLLFHLLPSARLDAVLTLAAVYAIVAYSTSLLYHQGGMLSGAQAAFMAVGAYTAAVLGLDYGWGFWQTLLPAIGLSALAGAVVGWPVARAKGHYFVLLTFSFGLLIVILIDNLKSVTHGDQGIFISGAPGSVGPISFDSAESFFYLALVFAALAALVVYAIKVSAFGRRLASIRDNESLARSLGMPVMRYKIAAFAVSAAIAGVGGVLLLYQQRIVVPDSFSLNVGLSFIIMIVLGGRGLAGPAVGVLALVLLPEMIGLSPNDKLLAYGVVLIAVVLLLPRGLVPGVTALGFRAVGLLRRRPPGPTTGPASLAAASPGERPGGAS